MNDAFEEFGPYAVYERLGQGGMATVHRAEKQGVGIRRPIALKRLLPHVAADPALVKLFVDEARLASHLHHANVAQTYELGRVGEIFFIAMEYASGPTLAQIIRQCQQAAGAIPLPITVEILSQVCAALDYAHNLCDETGEPLRIIHRDVSPANIIVTNTGVVKLIDFGIAKATISSVKTQTGFIKGKFGYIAPEYISGRIDARVDLFACGVVAHELLAGRRLFEGKDDFETLQNIREMNLQPPSRWNPDVPPELDDVVMTALARDPDHRWQTAGALQVALAGVARDLGPAVGGQLLADWVDWAFSLETDSSAPRRSSDSFDEAAAFLRSASARPASDDSAVIEVAHGDDGGDEQGDGAGEQDDAAAEAAEVADDGDAAPFEPGEPLAFERSDADEFDRSLREDLSGAGHAVEPADSSAFGYTAADDDAADAPDAARAYAYRDPVAEAADDLFGRLDLGDDADSSLAIPIEGPMVGHDTAPVPALAPRREPTAPPVAPQRAEPTPPSFLTPSPLLTPRPLAPSPRPVARSPRPLTPSPRPALLSRRSRQPSDTEETVLVDSIELSRHDIELITPFSELASPPPAKPPPLPPSLPRSSRTHDVVARPPSEPRRSQSYEAVAPPRPPSEPRRSQSYEAVAPPRPPSEPRRSQSYEAVAPPRPPSEPRRSQSQEAVAPPRPPSEPRRSQSQEAVAPPRPPSEPRRSQSHEAVAPPRRSQPYDAVSPPRHRARTQDTIPPPTSEPRRSQPHDAVSAPPSRSRTQDAIPPPSEPRRSQSHGAVAPPSRSQPFDAVTSSPRPSQAFDAVDAQTRSSQSYDAVASPQSRSQPFDAVTASPRPSQAFDAVDAPTRSSQSYDASPHRSQTLDAATVSPRRSRSHDAVAAPVSSPSATHSSVHPRPSRSFGAIAPPLTPPRGSQQLAAASPPPELTARSATRPPSSLPLPLPPSPDTPPPSFMLSSASSGARSLRTHTPEARSAFDTPEPLPVVPRPPRSRAKPTQKTRPQPRSARDSAAVIDRDTGPVPRRRRFVGLILLMIALGCGAMAAAYFWPDL